MVDRLQLDNVGRVNPFKIKIDPVFEPERPALESAEPTADGIAEPTDGIAEPTDETMELAEDEEDQETTNTTTSTSSRKKKDPFIFSVKTRCWFREHYTCSSEKKSFITHEEILSEYLQSHPEAGPLSTITIGKMIKFVWNDTVKCCRRRVHDVDGKTRKQGYFTLVRKTPCQETTTLSKSILHLPAADIAFPGWSVECLYKQHGIRYRKPIQQFYVNNHAAMLEVYFSFHDDQANDGINNGNDEVDKDETCKSNATLLCHGTVINAEELDLWDNKWVPTLKKVQVLLDVIGNSSICFGYDMEESWSTEFLNSNERTVVVHKCFEDVISNNGQRKLMSVDCKILSTMIGSYCDHCCHVIRTVSRRESRKKTANNKDQTYRNNSKMTRKELEDKLNKIQSELQKSKYRERSLLKKLSDINGTIVNNYDGIESEESESSSAHEG